MCGHIFVGYQHYQALRQPQALWRCSVCGRQSHMPLDCCARPDDHLCQPSTMVAASRQRLGALMGRVQTHVLSWLRRRRQLDVESLWTEDKQHMTYEPLNTPLSDTEMVAQPNELTEEMHNGVRELQLR